MKRVAINIILNSPSPPYNWYYHTAFGIFMHRGDHKKKNIHQSPHPLSLPPFYPVSLSTMKPLFLSNPLRHATLIDVSGAGP